MKKMFRERQIIINIWLKVNMCVSEFGIEGWSMVEVHLIDWLECVCVLKYSVYIYLYLKRNRFIEIYIIPITYMNCNLIYII